GFMGSPGMTLFETQLVNEDGLALMMGRQRILIDTRELDAQPAVAARAGGKVIAGVRAEGLVPAPVDDDGRCFRAELRFQEQLGSSLVAYFAVSGLTEGG